MRQTQRATVGLYALVLLAFALRIARLGAQDLWGDEAFSAWLAQRPLSSILPNLAQGEPHPPLYPVLLWAWSKLAGQSELALRYASLVFGVAMVPMVGVLGRRLRGNSLALSAALLATINPFLVWYSQEARMYITVATFATLAAVALAGAFAGKRRAWLSFALAAVLMSYSHYYGLLALAGFTLVVTIGLLGRRLPWRPWLAALALIAALYLPWVLYASRIFFSYYGVAPGRVDLWDVLSGFWLHSTLGWTAEQGDIFRRLPLFLALLAVGIGGAIWQRREGASCRLPLLIGAWLMVPLLGGFLISIVRPMYAERYLIISTVPLIVGVAAGIVYPRRLWLQAAALALTVVATFSPLRSQYLDNRFLKSEYSQHTAEVEGLGLPGDAIVLDGASQGFLFDYYYKGRLPHSPIPTDVPLDEAATAAQLRELAGRHSGLWVFLYATRDYDPADFVEKWLSNNAFRAWHTWTVNGRLVYYATYQAEDLIAQPLVARFGDWLALTRFATRLSPYTAGEVIPLLFNWRALAIPERDFKLSLRLRDSEGSLWGQTDAEPVSGFRPTRTWAKGDEVEDRLGVLILPGTPPGRYTLELRVYPPGGAPLSISGDGVAKGQALTLGEVHVARPTRHATNIGIPAFNQVGVSFGGQIALLGESGMGEVTAGQRAYLTLLWQALSKPPADYEALFELVDRRGGVAAEIAAPPVNGTFGTGQWAEGDVLRWQYNLRVPPKTPGGEYSLRLSLRQAGGPALDVAKLDGSSAAIRGNGVELRRIAVNPRLPRVSAAQPQVGLRAVLGGKIALRGYSLDPAPAGGNLPLTLYWEPLAEGDVAYTVFAHLVDGNGRIWGQQDREPCGGGCPTTSWVPGDLIEDHYELPVKSDAPAGSYQIAVGLYQAASGARLPVFGADGQPAGDRILIPNILLKTR